MYISNKAKEALKELGNQIRQARKRRLWTIAELANKIQVTAPTIIALEKGAPTVSVGALAAVLWTLGLENELSHLSQLNDSEGIKLMNSRLPKKIRTKKGDIDNDF